MLFYAIVPFKDTGFSVTNTQVRAGYIFFFGVAEGTLRVGDELNQQFDEVFTEKHKIYKNLYFRLAVG